jgi:pSer/pThr/pTyr-binding forkhead associated (FHA) protein
MSDPSRPMHSMRPVELQRLRDLEAAGAPFLSWRDDEGAWSFHVLDARAERPFALGRAPGSDIVIADTRVSSLHAELRRTGDHWLIEDPALSTNGTFVNGARVAQRRLRDQDSVLVGGTRITFHEPGRASAVTTTVKKPTVQPVDLKPTEWQVLRALCRRAVVERSGDVPSTPVLARELHLAPDSVDRTLTVLFRRFEVTADQGNKRRHLIDAAIRSGVVSANHYRD